MERVRCCEMVHDDFGVSFHQCTRYAKVESGGKHYCGRHDPDAVKRRREQSFAAYKAKMNARRANPIADELANALEGLLAYAQEVESKMLVGHEGSHWPVEIARAALARYRHNGGK